MGLWKQGIQKGILTPHPVEMTAFTRYNMTMNYFLIFDTLTLNDND